MFENLAAELWQSRGHIQNFPTTLGKGERTRHSTPSCSQVTTNDARRRSEHFSNSFPHIISTIRESQAKHVIFSRRTNKFAFIVDFQWSRCALRCPSFLTSTQCKTANEGKCSLHRTCQTPRSFLRSSIMKIRWEQQSTPKDYARVTMLEIRFSKNFPMTRINFE